MWVTALSLSCVHVFGWVRCCVGCVVVCGCCMIDSVSVFCVCVRRSRAVSVFVFVFRVRRRACVVAAYCSLCVHQMHLHAFISCSDNVRACGGGADAG